MEESKRDKVLEEILRTATYNKFLLRSTIMALSTMAGGDNPDKIREIQKKFMDYADKEFQTEWESLKKLHF
jgi:hypothetical protein